MVPSGSAAAVEREAERGWFVCALGCDSPLLVLEGKVTVPCVPLVVYKDQNL